jgi:hypothetical protein
MAILLFNQLFERFPERWRLGKIILAAEVARADLSPELIDEVTKLPDGTNAELPERETDLFLIIQTEAGKRWLDLRDPAEGLVAGQLVSCGISEDLVEVAVTKTEMVPSRMKEDYKAAVRARMKQYAREKRDDAAKVAPPPDPELPPDE